MALKTPDLSEMAQVLRSLCHEDFGDQPHYRAFCQFYGKATTQSPDSVYHTISMRNPVLGSHSQLLEGVSKLRDCCQKSQTNIINDLFPQADRRDAEIALRVVVKVGYMFDCASVTMFSQQYRNLRDGSFPIEWQKEQTFVELVGAVFPPSLDGPYDASDIDRALKGWKLRRRYGIRMVPTDDLVQHLYYDHQMKTLSVFHQVAWLKAQLRYTSDADLSEPAVSSIKRGTLPPQLLLETLYTIHHILLPIDKRSVKMARQLVRHPEATVSKFDPDILIYEGLVRSVSQPFQIVYWKRRLNALREIVDRPPPSNPFTAWFERHTSERNALTVAILGLFLAGLFGFLSFIVGLAQLWVSILAWKYPVKS